MNDIDAFLIQEVESASPAKLRWLLIRKAIGLCQAVDQLWIDQRWDEADQWLVRVRDIVGELLAGVTDPDNPASLTIADIYTFLLTMLEKIENSRNLEELRKMIGILDIELGTWDLFVKRENQASRFHLGFPVQASSLGAGAAFTDVSEWSGLNVEA